jgi:hypothetical protein
MIVAAVALIFAVAGTAIAGPGSISSKISKSKVKKIAKKQIAKAAPGLSVAKAASADTAANADAVNGHKIFKIFATIPVGSADQTIATFAGYTLSASCTPGGDLDRLLLLPPDTPFTNQTSTGNGDQGPVFSYGGGSAIRMDSDGTTNNTRGAASFSAARSDGIVLTGVIGFDNDPAFGQGSGCAVYGEVTQAG